MKKNKKILVTMTITLSAFFLVYGYKVNKHLIYMFNGSNSDITITDGVIFKNNNIALISGSNIKFLNKEILSSKYKAGYYIKENVNLKPILIVEGELDREMPLKEILEEEGIFNLNLSDADIKLKDTINKEFVFIIESSDDDFIEYTNQLDLSVTNLKQ